MKTNMKITDEKVRMCGVVVRPRAQNTTQKSISTAFCVSSIRHDSSLSKYRKQKQSPLEILKMAHVQGGGTASVYGTCWVTNHDE
jgi:hypothetical protein